MTYSIYWNSHRQMFSIKHEGKVVHHAHSVNAFDAKLVVQPAGQRRVRETGHKTVHAFVRAPYIEILEPTAPPMMFHKRKISYDPRVNDTFVMGEEPIHQAESVSMRVRNKRPELLI